MAIAVVSSYKSPSQKDLKAAASPV